MNLEINIKQLANRLEIANSFERSDALQELCSLARSNPDVVGPIAIGKILNILRENGSIEEYQDILEILERLIKSKDKSVSSNNAQLVIDDVRNVELILDLLDHPDLMVGVMTSQLLTELHSISGSLLEGQIQMCPEGMTKLLRQLLNHQREEVRNQALVFIQQLTRSNEEMKKSFVFNDGLDILFGIIREEGGSQECSIVTQDCLQIISNVLFDSETCQRFCFGMGMNWIFFLGEFFDPNILEQIAIKKSSALDSDSVTSPWYSEHRYVICATLALQAIVNALQLKSWQFRQVLATRTSSIVLSAAHWLARQGPAPLFRMSLAFFYRLLDLNLDPQATVTLPPNASSLANTVREQFASFSLRIAEGRIGWEVPTSLPSVPPLGFGWNASRSSSGSSHSLKEIEITSLIAERYLFAESKFDWNVVNANSNSKNSTSKAVTSLDISWDTLISSGAVITTPLSSSVSDHTHPNASRRTMEEVLLKVLEVWLKDEILGRYADPLFQYFLTPPPPSPEEEDRMMMSPDYHNGRQSNNTAQEMSLFDMSNGSSRSTLPSRRSLALLVAVSQVEAFRRLGTIFLPGSNAINMQSQPLNLSLEFQVLERGCNIFTALLLYGSPLARELTTMLRMHHATLFFSWESSGNSNNSNNHLNPSSNNNSHTNSHTNSSSTTTTTSSSIGSSMSTTVGPTMTMNGMMNPHPASMMYPYPNATMYPPTMMMFMPPFALSNSGMPTPGVTSSDFTVSSNSHWMSFWLSAVGKILRYPRELCDFHVVMKCAMALLRMLSLAVLDCLPLVQQILEDPSHLFVFDIASNASESQGLSTTLQSMASFFVGCCFLTLHQHQLQKDLPSTSNGTETPIKATINANSDSFLWNSDSILQIIDQRIGLSRFLQLLRRPLSDLTYDSSMNQSSAATPLLENTNEEYLTFFTSMTGFHPIYNKQVEAIRSALFSHYAGSGKSRLSLDDSPSNHSKERLQKIIDIQRERIEELEKRLEKGAVDEEGKISTDLNPHSNETSNNSNNSNSYSNNSNNSSNNTKVEENLDWKELFELANQSENSLRDEVQRLSEAFEEKEKDWKALEDESHKWELKYHSERDKNEQLQQELHQLHVKLLTSRQNQPKDGVDGDWSPNDNKSSPRSDSEEVLSLKQRILSLNDELKQNQELLQQKDRKISLLEEVMKSPVPFEKNREKLIQELESRNADLKTNEILLKSQLQELTNELANREDHWKNQIAAAATSFAPTLTDSHRASLEALWTLFHEKYVLSNLSNYRDPPEFEDLSSIDWDLGLEVFYNAMDDYFQEIERLVNTGSDMVASSFQEVHQMPSFTTEEACLDRIVECFELFQYQLQESRQNEASLSWLQQELESVRLSLDDSQRMNIALQEEKDLLLSDQQLLQQRFDEDTQRQNQSVMQINDLMSNQLSLEHQIDELNAVIASQLSTIQCGEVQLHESEAKIRDLHELLAMKKEECEEKNVLLQDMSLEKEQWIEQQRLSERDLQCDRTALIASLQEKYESEGKKQLDNLENSHQLKLEQLSNHWQETEQRLRQELEQQVWKYEELQTLSTAREIDLENRLLEYQKAQQEWQTQSFSHQQQQESHQKQMDLHSQELKDVQEMNHSLRQQLVQLQTCWTSSQKDHQKLEKDKKVLHEKYEKKEKDCEELQCQVQDLESRLVELQAAKEEECKILLDQLLASKQDFEELQRHQEQEISTRQSNVTNLEQEYQQYRMEMDVQCRMLQERCDGMREEWEQRLLEHETEKEQLRADMELQNAALVEQIQRLNSRIDELLVEIQQNEDAKQAWNLSMTQLNLVHQESRQQMEEQHHLSIQEITARWEMRCDELQQKCSSWADEKQEFLRIVANKDEIVAQLEQTISTLTLEKELFVEEKSCQDIEMQALLASQQDCQQELQICKQNLDRQNQEWEAEKQAWDIRMLEWEAEKVNHQLMEDNYSQELNNLKENLGQKEQDILSLTNALSEQNQERQRLEDDRNQLQDLLKELQEASESLIIDLKTMQDKENDYLIRQEQSETSLKLLTSELESIRQDQSALQTLQSELQSELQSWTNKLREKYHLNMLQSQSSNPIQWISVIQSVVEELIDTLDKKVNEERSFIASLESQIQELQSSVQLESEDSSSAMIKEKESEKIVASTPVKNKSYFRDEVFDSQSKFSMSTPLSTPKTRHSSDAMDGASTSTVTSTAVNMPTTSSQIKSPFVTPSVGTWKDVSRLVGSISPSSKELARVNSLLLKEKRQHQALQEEHGDLLSLLAQQELEFTVFRTALLDLAGPEKVHYYANQAEKTAIEKYGSYVHFRTSNNE